MSLVSSNKLAILYRQLLRIRLIEEAIAKRYSEQKMRCPVHLSIGQEAVAVGVCAHLKPTDLALSTHRAHAHYLAKGGDLKAMLAEIHGKVTGCAKGRGGSMHLVDLDVGFMGSTPIVGGSLPVAVGCAFAAKLKGEETLTVVFFGEGATEEGVFAEAINFASLHQLPILFVCEHNFYSVYSPMEVRQSPKRDRCLMARSQGIATFEGNGNHLESAYKSAGEAVAYMKAEKKPGFLELVTYRYKEHCGPYDDPFRPEAEVKEWLARDPLLQAPHEMPLKQWQEEIDQEIEEAFAFAYDSPFPTFSPEEENPYA